MIRIALSLLLCVAPALSAAQQIQSPDCRATLDSLNVRVAPHTIASFPGALASSTVALASLGNLAPFLAGTGLTLTARPFDHEVQGALADRVEGVGDLGDAIGHGLVVTGGTLGLFAAGQIARRVVGGRSQVRPVQRSCHICAYRWRLIFRRRPRFGKCGGANGDARRAATAVGDSSLAAH